QRVPRALRPVRDAGVGRVPQRRESFRGRQAQGEARPQDRAEGTSRAAPEERSRQASGQEENTPVVRTCLHALLRAANSPLECARDFHAARYTTRPLARLRRPLGIDRQRVRLAALSRRLRAAVATRVRGRGGVLAGLVDTPAVVVRVVPPAEGHLVERARTGAAAGRAG